MFNMETLKTQENIIVHEHWNHVPPGEFDYNLQDVCYKPLSHTQNDNVH
jgi:hypothetical protein